MNYHKKIIGNGVTYMTSILTEEHKEMINTFSKEYVQKEFYPDRESMSSKIQYLVTADIHFGVMDSDRLLKELQLIIDYAKEITNGLIVISGDLFDFAMSASSSHYKAALQFLMQLMFICLSNNNKLRILKGTLSHDANQLEALDELRKVFPCDVRFIMTVEEELVYPGLRVLYLPEEYQEHPEEYYEPYLGSRAEGEYGLIFGHGMLDKATFHAEMQETEVTHPHVYNFPVDTLEERCTGYIYFGHIHKRLSFGRCKYINSFSRFGHGEEDDKGFYIGTYDTQTDLAEDIFIVNKAARTFYTHHILSDHELYEQYPNPSNFVYELLKETDQLTELYDQVRIKVEIPASYEQGNLLNAILVETYTRKQRIKLVIVSVKKEKVNDEIKQEMVDMVKEMGGLLSDKLEMPEKLQMFIQRKKGILIEISKITKIIDKYLPAILDKTSIK